MSSSPESGSETPPSPGRTAPSGSIALRLAAVLLPLAFWMALAAQYMFSGSRVSNDSAAYIDCARSIREGRGFQTRPWSGLAPETWEPIKYWPPGYPILVAGAMTLGLSPYHAALAVSVVCSGLFVIVVLGYYVKQLPFAVAAMLGIVFVSMRALLDAGTMCWSEGPYLLLTVVSLLCLMKGTSGERVTGSWLLVAGLTGGLSWCVRNVAVALFASSVCYLLAQILRLRLREAALAVCAWLGGWILGCGWLVLWNLATFGVLSPYKMPPSDSPFLWNCKDAFQVMGRDLTALGHFSDVIANKYVLIAFGIAILFLARRLSWRGVAGFLQDHRDRLVLLLFLGFYTLAIVVARSVYRWGEGINSRHFVPVYWILLLFLGIGVDWVVGRAWAGKRRTQVVLVMALGLLAALQIKASVMDLAGSADERDKTIRSIAVALGREIPEGKLVLSDAIAPLRVFGNLNARYPPRPSYDETPLTWSDIRQAGNDGRLWGIVLVHDNEYAQGKFGDALRDISANPHGFPELREREARAGVRRFAVCQGGHGRPVVRIREWRGASLPGHGLLRRQRRDWRTWNVLRNVIRTFRISWAHFGLEIECRRVIPMSIHGVDGSYSKL